MDHIALTFCDFLVLFGQPSTCSQLRAVAEKNMMKKGYDATGVVAVACARHGCFAPGSVVDMQKGERYACIPMIDGGIALTYGFIQAGQR